MILYIFVKFLVITQSTGGNLPSKGMRKSLGFAWKAINGNVEEFA